MVDGALYTDVNAQLPALYLLIAISLSAVVLLVFNLRQRGWTLPIIAVGLWAFVAIVMGGIYPAFVQRFQVEPNETSREVEFTQRNIGATREAFGLEPDADVTETAFAYTTDVTADELRENATTVRNTRVLDPVVTHPTFERFEALRDFYRFEGAVVDVGATFAPSLDTDRYLINGELTQVVLGTRELNLADLSWEREHVRLTHGYGLALLARTPPHLRAARAFLPVVCRSRPIRHSPFSSISRRSTTVKALAGTPSSAPRSTKSTMSTARPIRTFRFATTATRVSVWGRSFGGLRSRCGSVRSSR